MKSMEELFHAQLQDVYFAEKQLLKALPKLAKKSTNRQLAEAFTNHLKETEGQVERLEKLFELIEKKPRTRKCDAILGIVSEGEEIIEEVDDDAVRDAGLVAAGQAAEHYEIARYGTLVAWAELLGLEDAVKHVAAEGIPVGWVSGADAGSVSTSNKLAPSIRAPTNVTFGPSSPEGRRAGARSHAPIGRHVVVIVNCLAAPGPVPCFVGIILGRPFELLLADVDFVAFEARIVGQQRPRQRIVVFSDAHEAAEAHDRISDLATELVPPLYRYGSVHGFRGCQEGDLLEGLILTTSYSPGHEKGDPGRAGPSLLISVADSWRVPARYAWRQTGRAVERWKNVPYPLHDRPYHDVQPRRDVTLPHSHGAQLPCCVRLSPSDSSR
jgi:ferritin-like metal-binding protein YciE